MSKAAQSTIGFRRSQGPEEIGQSSQLQKRSFSPLAKSSKTPKNAGKSVLMPLSGSAKSSVFGAPSESAFSMFDLPDVDQELYVRFLPKKWDDKLVEWAEDDDCYLCGVHFQKLTLNDAKKRTHCRRCGNSVCRLCCSNEIQLSQINPKKEKVCNSCCADIQNLHVRSLYR